MAELSGVAKLSNGDPASQIVAVHPLRGHVRTAVPAPDGSYSIPGVPKGKWLVTAEGPAGYRPLSHVLDVERVPEAETLYPKIWEAWNFDNNRVGQKRGSSAITNAAGAGDFVQGKNGDAISISASTNATHAYEPGAGIIECSGYAAWFRVSDRSSVKNLPTIHSSPTTSGTASAFLDAQIATGTNQIVVRARLSTGTRYMYTIPVQIPLHEWIFFSFVVDANGVAVWIDSEKFYFAQSIPPSAVGTPRYFTVSNLGGAQLDDALQFIAPPTDDEIAYLYSAGFGRTWADIKADAGFV